MDGLAAAQRNYDATSPVDSRTDKQIEQDAAERRDEKLREAQKAAILEGYVYSPDVWAGVIAARKADEIKKSVLGSAEITTAVLSTVSA